MSDVNLAMQKTIEIILSVLVIISSIATIYTYDSEANYMLSFSSAKLKLIYDNIMLYHDKGLKISFNEYYPFNTNLKDDLITLELDGKKISTKLETINISDSQKTEFEYEILLSANKLESYELVFQDGKLIPNVGDFYRGIAKPSNLCQLVKECKFNEIPKIYFDEISKCNIDINNIVCN